ncbi:FAD-dependent oxidoreductase [Streptomyces sp. NPDC005892]|uniref:FAD-dependent oxidoreductase n=1 Tax=Streptomyces sp. NPDC005892 TaxID=3155593 RepID=UPI0033E4D051
MRHVVVVGNGMAGHRIASELHAGGSEVRITVLGAEPHAAYNRVLLTNLLAGKADERSIRLPDLPPGITVRTGVAVTAVDRVARTVTAADGSVTGYDTLVLATGGSALLPPVKGLHGDDGVRLLPGIVVLRTLDDCQEVFRLVEGAERRTDGDSARVLVLGGGLLGLEAARGLVQRGIGAEILQGGEWLMSRQLDGAGGRALRASLAELGVAARVGVQVESVVGDSRFEGVRCADGQLVPGDVLVVACGMRPATALAAAAGLPVGRGIVVDDRMRTADPRIFAIGDCAEHRGTLYGLVQPAWEQARVAARTIAALPGTEPYRGTRVVTRLKTTGIDLATMGEVGADGSDDGDEVLTYLDSSRNVYQKLVIRDGRVAGAILVGGSATVGTITQLFDRRAAVPQDRRLLLFPELAGAAARTTAAADELVCLCNGVPRSEILRHCAGAGAARSVASVAASTRATTGCGGCRPLVEELLAGLPPADGAG